MLKILLKKLGTKALEAGVNKFGSEIGTRAANKVISAADNKFSILPTKSLIESYDLINLQKVVIRYIEVELTKPLGNVIMKELNKKKPSDETTSENLNTALKNNIMVMEQKINIFKIN